MSWFRKIIPNPILGGKKRSAVPEGLWVKCNDCQAVLYRSDLERNLLVCLQCGSHMRMSARERLQMLFDDGAFDEIAANITPTDPLNFRDLKKYRDRLNTAQKTTSERDACVVGKGAIYGIPLVGAAFEFNFMGGSMGAVVGERLCRAINHCVKERLPLTVFTASGGARMQEGLISLLQMAKTSAAVAKLRAARLPFISVMTDPTMGGVSASFAMLGDVHIAEPNALVGFAGPRVIEQTVREKLPEGFQRSEFLLKHGAIDMVCDRRELKKTIAQTIRLLTHSSRSGTLENITQSRTIDAAAA